jgi:hypothetical protein
LMESVSSCTFFSQVLGCLTNSSLVFPLITILSSFWDSVFCSFYSAGLAFRFVLHLCFILFSEVFPYSGSFPL